MTSITYPCDDQGTPVEADGRQARLEALPALVRVMLAKQPRCRGTFRFPQDGPRDEPLFESPCYPLFGTAKASGKIAMHIDYASEAPDLCDECAAWNEKYNGTYRPSVPRDDIDELSALIAAVENL